MNILFISQAVSREYVEIIKNSLGKDAKIDLITGADINTIDCLRVFQSPKHNSLTIKTRIICWYKHYCYIKWWYKKNRCNHYDLIFATSNPPINSYIGLELKRKFHAKFIYMNWDLYPQVIQMSAKHNISHTICKLWEQWNTRNYRKIDGMLTIGKHVAKTIENSVRNSIKVDVIPIATDTVHIKPVTKEENSFIKNNGLENKFIVLYSGKMGHEHNIELILEASKLLVSNNDIIFIFIGSGEKYKIVEKFLEENNSENVKLFGYQPREIFPMSIACGDIGVVTVEDRSSKLLMPSKTYNIMAAGEAVLGLCSKNCDLAELIINEEIGQVVDSNNPTDVANAIQEMFLDKQKLSFHKANSRNVAIDKYSKGIVTEQYRKYFAKILNG